MKKKIRNKIAISLFFSLQKFKKDNQTETSEKIPKNAIQLIIFQNQLAKINPKWCINEF